MKRLSLQSDSSDNPGCEPPGERKVSKKMVSDRLISKHYQVGLLLESQNCILTARGLRAQARGEIQ
jgi:hypothetical protein